jgi:hypothetical protein
MLLSTQPNKRRHIMLSIKEVLNALECVKVRYISSETGVSLQTIYNFKNGKNIRVQDFEKISNCIEGFKK